MGEVRAGGGLDNPSDGPGLGLGLGAGQPLHSLRAPSARRDKRACANPNPTPTPGERHFAQELRSVNLGASYEMSEWKQVSPKINV